MTYVRRTHRDGVVVHDRRMIQVQSRAPGTPWRAHESVYPGDRPGSATVLLEGRETTVVYGWDRGRAMLWRATDRPTSHDLDSPLQSPSAADLLADLGKGPVELAGPRGRWRWRMTT